MRRTLFWTSIYASIGFAVIGVWNVLYDFQHSVNVDPNHAPSYQTFIAIMTNQDQIIINQQITHTMILLVLIFLFVRLYYEKHPREGPIVNVLPTKLKEDYHDIPAEYFDDARKKSIEDRKAGYSNIVNQNTKRQT